MSTNEYVITLDSDKTLTAEYVEEIATITLNVVAGVGGTVAPSGQVAITVGTTYAYTASPSTGYNFNHWDLGGVSKGSDQTLNLLTENSMNGLTLTALFTTIQPQPITVTIAISGNGTTDLTPGAHEFHVGDTITIAAIPSAGTAFKQWRLDSVTYTDNPLSLPVTEDLNGKTLSAEFVSLTPQAASLLVPAIAVISLIGLGAAYSWLKKRKGGR